MRLPGQTGDGLDVNLLTVGPGFLGTMGIPLVAGTDLEPRDIGPEREITRILVNETLVEKVFGNAHAVGQRLRIADGPDGRLLEIAGVVKNAKYYDLHEGDLPIVYWPLTELERLTMQVRTRVEPATLLALMRTVAPRVHPDLAAVDVARQATLVDNSVLRDRLLALLSGFFAVVALLLAAVGLYGVLSYAVLQRTREIGIRLALGAQRRLVAIAVLRGVWLAAVVGLAEGLIAGLLLSRWVKSLLFDVRPSDAGSLAWPALCLVVVALAAAVVPAWRATRVDPMVTLRAE